MTTEDEAILLAAFLPRITGMISRAMEKDGTCTPDVKEAINRHGKCLVDDLISAMRANREQRAGM